MHGMGEAYRAQQRMADSDIASAEASTRKTQVGQEMRFLDERVDKLVLACMAMWELLKDRTELTEEDLLGKIQQIDLRDGQADGRITNTVAKCPKCGRTMSPRHKKCLYCGASKLNVGAFDATT